MTRGLAAVFLTLALSASPARAETFTAVSQSLLGVFDACLASLSRGGGFETGAERLGFTRTTSGVWTRKVDGIDIVAGQTSRPDPGGATIKTCIATAGAAVFDRPALESAMVERARFRGLPVIPQRRTVNGERQTVFEEERAGGVIALMLIDRPASGGRPAMTTLSAVWRQPAKP